MIDDPDIFRAAKLLVDQHGEVAPLRIGLAKELEHDAETDFGLD
jgi:hypothetical protein